MAFNEIDPRGFTNVQMSYCHMGVWHLDALHVSLYGKVNQLLTMLKCLYLITIRINDSLCLLGKSVLLFNFTYFRAKVN